MLNKTPITDYVTEPAETVFSNKFATVRLVPSLWGPHVSIQSGTGKGAVLLIVNTAAEEPEVLLVNQPRFALTPTNVETNGYYTWELPRGGHQNDETLMECAIRELEEETNLVYPPDYIFHLGSTFTDTGIMNTVVDYFYAEVNAENHEVKYNDNEILNHKWVPLQEVLEAVKNNHIQDAYTVNALMKATLHGKISHTR